MPEEKAALVARFDRQQTARDRHPLLPIALHAVARIRAVHFGDAGGPARRVQAVDVEAIRPDEAPGRSDDAGFRHRDIAVAGCIGGDSGGDGDGQIAGAGRDDVRRISRSVDDGEGGGQSVRDLDAVRVEAGDVLIELEGRRDRLQELDVRRQADDKQRRRRSRRRSPPSQRSSQWTGNPGVPSSTA